MNMDKYGLPGSMRRLAKRCGRRQAGGTVDLRPFEIGMPIKPGEIECQLVDRNRRGVLQRARLVHQLQQSGTIRLSYEPDTPLPAWMSPTASMLDQPHFPR